MQTNYYSVIPGEIRMSNLPDGAKILFGDISSLSNREGYCFASNAYLSQISGKSLRTIQRWIQEMDELGFLKIEIDNFNNRKIYIGIKNSVSKSEQKLTQKSDDIHVIPPGHECHTPMTGMSYPHDMNVIPIYKVDNNIDNNSYSFSFNKNEKKENEDFENGKIFDLETLKKFINFGSLSEKFPWKNLETSLIDFFLFYEEKGKIIKKQTAQMQFDRWLKGPKGMMEQEKASYEQNKKRIFQVDKIYQAEKEREKKEQEEITKIRDFLEKNPKKAQEWREFHEQEVLELSKGSKQVAEALMRGKLNREARLFLEKTGHI